MSKKESGCGSLFLAAFAVIGLVMFVNHLAGRGNPVPPADKAWVVTSSQGGARFVAIERPHASDASAYQRAAREICGDGWCQVSFWVEGDPAGTALPLSPAQARAQAAVFLQNPSTNTTRWAWNCDTYFPDGSPCLAGD